ncbi:MAG: TonB family protein [Polyangiaceae bacterium]
MRWPSLPWLFWAFSSSFALHGVAWASLSMAPRAPAQASLNSVVTLEVSEPLPPLPTVTPEPEPAPEADAPKPVAKIARAEPTPAAPAATAPAKSEAPPSAAPLDLSGVTLTNDQGSGFGMALGNGQAFNGPIGNGRVAARSETVTAPKPVAPSGPLLVAASDLSARPVPPALDGSLRQNYPRDAKERAIGGSAKVMARIDPDGSVRQIRVENESFPGFGEACRKTLQGSRWSAPRDREGRAVATEIRYTCRFLVEP